MVLWNRSVLGRQKVPRNVPARFFKFRGVSGSLGQIRLGPLKGPWEGSTAKIPPRLRKFRYLSGSLGQILLGLPKGSVLKGSLEGSPRFHQGFTNVAQVS